MKQVEINGILWDTENVEINGEKYFTFEQATNIAKILGKRLPTREELKSIFEDGYIWDNEKVGLWDCNKKIFIPADGIIAKHRGINPVEKGRAVHIWSSELSKDDTAFFLNGYSTDIITIRTMMTNKVPVRLVQDMPKDEEGKVTAFLESSFKKSEYFVNLEKRIEALEQEVQNFKEGTNIKTMSMPFDCKKFEAWNEYIAELEELSEWLKKFKDILTKE